MYECKRYGCTDECTREIDTAGLALGRTRKLKNYGGAVEARRSPRLIRHIQYHSVTLIHTLCGDVQLAIHKRTQRTAIQVSHLRNIFDALLTL